MTQTAKIRARARGLVKMGCPPTVAIHKASRELAISEGRADPTRQRSGSLEREGDSKQQSSPQGVGRIDGGAEMNREPHRRAAISRAIREQLLDSYKHKRLDETECAFCRRVGTPIALHVVEFHHPEARRTPSSFIPMSRSRGTTRGSVPVCIRCSPQCRKCALPVATPWTAKMAKALQARHSEVSITLGDGVCHQHIHAVQNFLSLFRHARIPSDGAAGDRDPVTAARRTLWEIEADGSLPAIQVIKDQLLALIADRERTSASLVQDGLKPKALIYLLINNVLHAELCTGRHHIYRGVLSARGQQLLADFVLSSERMIEHGVHDRPAHEADVANVRKELSQIG